ncbi:MAG: hypothetical protein CMH54_08855 [Myxococcales bacterium]|nr:hypothetical protein [Myxococcales bacterium]
MFGEHLLTYSSIVYVLNNDGRPELQQLRARIGTDKISSFFFLFHTVTFLMHLFGTRLKPAFQHLNRTIPISVFLILLLLGCSPAPSAPTSLLLAVSMDDSVEAPLDARILRIRIRGEDGGVVIPTDPDDPAYNIDIQGRDLQETPYVAEILPMQLHGLVQAQVLAFDKDNQVMAARSIVFNIDQYAILEVVIKGADPCDEDRDGTLNCALDGCCPNPDLVVSDCDDQIFETNLFGEETMCEDCGNGIDEDCQNGDLECVDTDNDSVLDDCGDCGPEDATVGPGFVELCDGLDNNCDEVIDEGFTVAEGDVLIPLGEACGVGLCEGGVVVCETTESAICDSHGSAILEICDNQIDDDCDGFEDEGCMSNDQDGDGVVDSEDCPQYPLARYHSEIHPGAPESCCLASLTGAPDQLEQCDTNCDGEVTPCADDDLDGDGISPPYDCDDTDPNIHPADAGRGIDDPPEYCDDDQSQNCSGSKSLCETGVDADEDGFLAGQGDCDDEDPEIHPYAIERCNNVDDDCDGIVDDGNPETNGTWLFVDYTSDIPCHPDGETVATTGSCSPGVTVCAHGVIDPVTNQPSTEHQCLEAVLPAEEICDAELNDENCDGDDNNLNAIDCTTLFLDQDGDSFGLDNDTECRCYEHGFYTALEGGDCDDGIFNVNPLGIETCQTTYDDDCNGDTNDLNAVECALFYPDTDADNYGDAFADPECRCAATSAYPSQDNTDCNDNLGSIHPTAEEFCNLIDDDCDSETDEAFPLLNQACDGDDSDQCTYGTFSCTLDTLGIECIDEDPTNVEESCDNIDNDCDGETDEENAAGCTIYFADVDGDGYGVADDIRCLCSQVAPHTTTVPGDCNDGDEDVHPDITEICGNGQDDNCTGSTEGDPTGELNSLHDLDGSNCTTYYLDADEDSYGSGTAQCACGAIGAFSSLNSSDCDDGNPSVHPMVQETCTTTYDDNCNDTNNDESALNCTDYHLDEDGDTYGHPTDTKCYCQPFESYNTLNDTDCEDDPDQNGALINPGNTETCDTEFDDNCNLNNNDLNALNCTTYFVDEDQDAYGAPGPGQCLCSPIGDYDTTDNTDCEDDPDQNGLLINPGREETCLTPFDDDCDVDTNDLNANNCITYFMDVDNDGYGIDGDTECHCEPEDNYRALQGGDCNDSPVDGAAIHPDEPDSCNDIDDDCDGETDEGVLVEGCVFHYFDADNDGWGNDDHLCLCKPQGNYRALNTGDCVDDPLENGFYINPGQTESCNTDFDDNCNGELTELNAQHCTEYYVDNDGDGYGLQGSEAQCWCGPQGNYNSTNDNDCNDGEYAIRPGIAEDCTTSFDDNCNGDNNEVDSNNCGLFYLDEDQDGHGNDTVSGICLCYADAAAFFTAVNQDDCNDSEATAYGGPSPYPEICDDIDNDCDANTDEGESVPGCTSYYFDNDEDGYGDSVAPQVKCLCDPGHIPKFTSLVATDCVDTDTSIHPTAPDGAGTGSALSCNAVDDDCDGLTDEDITYLDLGVSRTFGDPCGTGACAGGTVQCAAGGAALFCTTDPSNSSAEVCDGVDNDCDSETDAEDAADLLAFDGQDCENQIGLCAGSTKPATLCTGGLWENCTSFEYSDHDARYEGVEASCDSVDNDCDGTEDESFPVNDPCNTNPSFCSNGIYECTADGSGTECVDDTPKADTTVCETPSCVDALKTDERLCDGAGSCETAVTTDCSPFGCNGLECHTNCSTDDSCAAGFFCDTDIDCSTDPACEPLEYDLGGYTVTQTGSSCSYTIPSPTMVLEGGYLIIARGPNIPVADYKGDFEAYWGVSLGTDTVLIDTGDQCPKINGGETYELTDNGGASEDGPTVSISGATNYQRNVPPAAPGAGGSWTLGSPTLVATPGSGQSESAADEGPYISEMTDAPGAGNYIYEFVEIYYDSAGASGACQSQLADGAVCSTDGQCASGNCTDGYCCVSADCGACSQCDATGSCSDHAVNTDPEADCGTCQACDGAGSCINMNNLDPKSECGTCRVCDGAGSCESVSAGSDPKNDCTAQDASTCGLTGDCDGANACAYWDASTNCQDNVCSSNPDGTVTFEGEWFCIAPLNCAATNIADCLGHVCSIGSGCLTPCVDSDQCLGEYYCQAPNCLLKKNGGEDCGGNEECISGSCISGTCAS